MREKGVGEGVLDCVKIGSRQEVVVVPARLVWTLISYLAGVVFCACSVRGPWPSRRLCLWCWCELGAGQGLHEVGEWSGPPESQSAPSLGG